MHLLSILLETMKPRATILFLLLTTSALAEGTWVGGGGDARFQHFAKAQIETPQLLSKLTVRSIRNDLVISALQASMPTEINKESALKLIEEVQGFIIDHKDELLSEVEHSKLSWQEKAHTETSKCAYTQLGMKKADVRLSYTSCISVANSIDAGRILVHESVHHIDATKTELFADLVSYAVFTAWENLLLTGIPMCPNAYRSMINTSESYFQEYNGTKPPTLKPGESVHYFNPNRHIVGKFTYKGPMGKLGYMEFTEDESVLADLPGIGSCAMLAGIYKFNRIYQNGNEKHYEYKYVLTTETSGASKISYFRPRPAPQLYDLEFLLISLIRNSNETTIELPKPEMDDVLYVGGDFPEESWGHLEREY